MNTMNKEEIFAKIRETIRYRDGVETIGVEAAERVLENAFETDLTPVICYNCPYRTGCKGKDVVPWLMRCTKYDDYKSNPGLELKALEISITTDEMLAELNRRIQRLEDQLVEAAYNQPDNYKLLRYADEIVAERRKHAGINTAEILKKHNELLDSMTDEEKKEYYASVGLHVDDK